ncbi:hypothetical protein Tco_1109488 [Tanacetum coccineum]
MLGTKPNSFYDPNMKVGLGYKNPERLKKAIDAQPKMYNGKNLKYHDLKVNLTDSEETLEDAEKISFEQTYLSPPSNSNVSPESSQKKSNLPSKKMPNESQLLKLFVNMDNEINELAKLIDIHHYIERDRSFIYDNKANIRRIFTLEVVPISRTSNKYSNALKQEITKEVQEMLEIFESMERKVDDQS